MVHRHRVQEKQSRAGPPTKSRLQWRRRSFRLFQGVDRWRSPAAAPTPPAAVINNHQRLGLDLPYLEIALYWIMINNRSIDIFILHPTVRFINEPLCWIAKYLETEPYVLHLGPCLGPLPTHPPPPSSPPQRGYADRKKRKTKILSLSRSVAGGHGASPIEEKQRRIQSLGSELCLHGWLLQGAFELFLAWSSGAKLGVSRAEHSLGESAVVAG